MLAIQQHIIDYLAVYAAGGFLTTGFAAVLIWAVYGAD